MMLLRELRHAVRSLVHARLFAVVAVACLSIGIGAHTTIFSVVDGVLLKPYPYREPDGILVLGTRHERDGLNSGVSLADLEDWREATTTFSTIAATTGRSVSVSAGDGEPVRYLAGLITWDLFPLLGVEPILGRGFSRDEDQPNAGGVVLLSHMMWTSDYRADAGILGRAILIDGTPHTVVGVMPPGFAFPENHRLWMPLTPASAGASRGARSLFTFGRLAPGVTAARATEDLTAITDRLASRYPETNEGWRARVRTLREAFLPPEVPLVLWLMMAGVTLVLAIACSNVANLLLARAAERSREFALRAAIGAGRARLVGQLLAEGLVLALVSVPMGLVIAVAGTRWLASLIPADQVPYYVTWQVDGRSLAWAFAVAAVTAVFFAVVPAVQVAGRNLQERLKEGGRGNTGGRAWLRNVLVVSQVSLALVALVGALLFVRTFRNLDRSSLGFDVAPVMTLRFYMTGDGYREPGSRARRVEDVVARVEQVPGVAAVFASNMVPIGGGGESGEVEVEGRANEEGQRPRITFTGVTPGFRDVMGVALLHGRDFQPAEVWSQAPVALVNQTMARRFWPDRDPLEQRFRLRRAGGDSEWFRVIGVLPDLQLYGIDPAATQPEASAFVPYAWQETASTGLTMRVQAGDPAAVTPAVRAALRASDPYMPLSFVQTLETLRQTSYWQFALFGWVFGGIGVVALALAAVGVYGVLAYSVTRRTQEIGVRVALGAARADILRLVVVQGLRLAGAGVVIGVILAALGMPLARTLLYEVSPFDPTSFAAVSLFLLAVAAVASYVPARRATRVDPLVALRQE
jgi:putative ABC transport system permease protein